MLLHWYKNSGSKKPIIGFIAGETAPAGRTMGHAGAIVGGSDDTAQAKKKIMRNCGIHVVDSPAEIGKKVAEVLASYKITNYLFKTLHKSCKVFLFDSNLYLLSLKIN